MNAFHLYNVTVFKWAFSSLLCLTLIGCQKQQPSEAVQQDSELNSYVDEQDQLRVPTWITYRGRVTIGSYVFESKMPEKKLLPKHLWMIEKKGSLEKVTSCVTGYTYIQDTNFTVSENSTIGYVVYYDGCNGWRCWCHSVEVKAVNTFHNDIFLEDFHHETDGWPCTQPASDYVGRYYSDNTYSAGAKFFVSSKYYNDFDSSSGCSTPAGLDLAHPGSVTLSAGGGTDSVTFDYMIMKASSASSNCSQVVCDSGTEE